MKRLVLFLLVMCTLTAENWAQWQRQYPLAKLENVLDIDLTAEGFGVAVGANAMVLTKSAGESTWRLRSGPSGNWRLDACDYAEGQAGEYLAVGGNGLAISQNGGNTWQEITGAPTGIKALKIIAPGDIVVVAASGVFRYASNTWDNLDLPVTSNVDDGEILDALHIWCFTTGANPAIYATANGGLAWSSTTDVPSPDIVRFYNAQYGMATDARKVYRSTNGGADWTLVSDGSIHNSSIDMTFGLSPNVLMAATFNGDPSISADSGKTWTQLDLGLVNERNYAVFAVSDQEFYTGNDISSITHTTDAGASWTETSGPERRTINDIVFLDRNNGFAIGNSGKILKTSNGGAQWEDVSFETSRSYYTIAGTGPNDLWIGTNQRILHSSDAGATWTPKGIFASGNISDILPLSPTTILACNTIGLIYRSTDAGATWDTVYQAPVANTQMRSLARMSGQRILATGFNGVIVRSANNGATWTPVAVPEAGLQYEQSHFIGEEGWLVTSSFKKTMWHTTTGGDAWTALTLPIDRNWDGVYFITQDTGIIVGRSSTEGRAYITFNGGMNWQASYTTSFPLYGVSGIPNPNGTAWIHGFGSDIEVLPYCTVFPVLTDLQGELQPCEKDTIQYTVSSQNSDDYFWFFPPGWQAVGSTHDDTVRVVVGQSGGNISVTASNTCGLSNNLSLGVGASLLPVVTTDGGDLTPCEGEVVTYSVTATNADDYAWILPPGWGIVTGEGTSSIQVLVTGIAGLVAVKVANDCGSANATWSVTPRPQPVSLNLTGENSPCPGDTVTYTFSGENISSVNWSLPGGWTLLGSSTGNQVVTIPGASGTVMASGVNDCGESADLSLDVTPETIPTAAVVVNGADLSLTQQGAAYQWYLNGLPITGANSATYKATASGNYACQITYATGCQGITNSVNVILTITLDPALARGLSVFPSPASAEIQINGLNETCAFTILDMAGRPMSTGRTGQARISVQSLAPGLYLLALDLPEGRGYLRFLKG